MSVEPEGVVKPPSAAEGASAVASPPDAPPVGAPDVTPDFTTAEAKASASSAAAGSAATDPIRAAEDAVRRARLTELKVARASGKRPPGIAHGRWLGDFLDQETDTGLLPAEEKLLTAVGRGEWCDLRRPAPKPIAQQIAEVRAFAKTSERFDPIDRERLLGSDRAVLDLVRDAVPFDSPLLWALAPCHDPSYLKSIIRAPLLRFLALGGDPDTPVHEKGVQLRGAVVTDYFDIQGCRNVRALWLDECRFEAAPVVRDASIAVLSLQGSRVPALRADRAEITGGVFLRNGFTAEGEVRLIGVKIGGQLNCNGGRLRNAVGSALACDGAEITGSVFLQAGFTAEGEVRFLGAKIGGSLDCEGGHFRGASGAALSCDGAEISGNVFLRREFAAEGEVRFLGVKIGGQLNCNGGKFCSAVGSTLACDGAEITGGVFLQAGFTAEGEVRLNGAKIGGDLNCIGGTFNNARSDDTSVASITETNARVALNVEAANIVGTLWLGPAAERRTPSVFHGSLSLQGAHAHQLVDHPSFWPGGANSPLIDEWDTDGKPTGRKLWAAFALDGFTYDRLVGQGHYDAETRLRWLARQPEFHRLTDFRPQPYEQLVMVLREMGHERDARVIAKARQSAERKARWHRNWPKKPLRAVGAQLERFFLGALAGYGYGTKRLIAMLLAIWFLGGIVYDAAERQGLMAPTSPIVFNDAVLKEKCGGLGQRWTACEALPKEHTAFGPWFYSADVVTPIVSFGLERDWAPIYSPPCAVDPEKCNDKTLPQGSVLRLDNARVLVLPWTFHHGFLWLVYWLQVVLGWGLSALLVAVLSGVMKKD